MGSVGGLTNNEKEPLSDAFVLSRDGYQVDYPDASPGSIAASKYFVRCVAFGVEGQYDDPWACMSTVVQVYKDFTGGWQWKGQTKTVERINSDSCQQDVLALFQIKCCSLHNPVDIAVTY